MAGGGQGRGSWYFRITVPGWLVNPLLNRGSLRLGQRTVRVDRWVRVSICFRCGHPGHQAARCTKPVGLVLCYRCGEAGHKAAACQGTQKCLACGEGGHRSNSSACRIYKEQLTVARGGGKGGKAAQPQGKAKGKVQGPIVDEEGFTRVGKGTGEKGPMASTAGSLGNAGGMEAIREATGLRFKVVPAPPAPAEGIMDQQ